LITNHLSTYKKQLPNYRLFCDLSHVLDFGIDSALMIFPFSLINISMSRVKFTTHFWFLAVAGNFMAFPYILSKYGDLFCLVVKKQERRSAMALVFFGCLYYFMHGVLFGYICHQSVICSGIFLGIYYRE